MGRILLSLHPLGMETPSQGVLCSESQTSDVIRLGGWEGGGVGGLPT